MVGFDDFEDHPQELDLNSKQVTPAHSIKHKQALHERWKRLEKLVRPGFILDHLDTPSFKIASRTYIQYFISLVLNTVKPVNNWFGGSSYLLNVANIWDPPGGYSVTGGVVMAFVNLLSVSLSIVFYMVIDAINWHIRGRPDISDIVIEPREDCQYGHELCMRNAILDGRFLDIRTTAVGIFGIIICLAWHYYLSSYRPYLRCAWLFGMVSALILIPESLHVPFWDPWAKVRSIIRCLGVACGIKAALCVLYLPVTSSFKLVSFLDKTLGSLKGAAIENFQNECFMPSEPIFKDKMASSGPKIERMLQKAAVYELDFVLCRYEVSYSRFDWEDIYELRTHIMALGNILYNYHFIYAEFTDRARNTVTSGTSSPVKTERPNLSRGFTTNPAFDYNTHSKKNRYLSKKYLEAGNFEQRRHAEYLKGDQEMRPLSRHSVDELFHKIVVHYSPINEACTVTLGILQDWMNTANNFRFSFLRSTRSKHEKRQREINERLRLSINSLARLHAAIDNEDEWVASIVAACGGAKGSEAFIAGQALYYGFICKEYVRNVRVVANWCLSMDERHPTPSWKTYRKSDKRTAVYKSYSDEFQVDGLDFDPESEPYVPLKAQRRDPECTPPRNFFHVITTKVEGLCQKHIDQKLVYSIKVGCTAIIPLIPFVISTSLEWVHRNRGIWAAITCMMSISPRASDTVFGLLSRLGATACGAVIGIACWYVAAGPTGDGNPYALVALMSVLGIGLVYFRHFNTVGGTIMSIVLMLTVTLVTMGSYCTKHNLEVMYSLNQSGAMLALCRFVALTVGIVIAFLSTIFPSFSTTKKTVRRSLGATLFTIGEVQADLVNFLYQRRDNSKVSALMFKDTITLKMRRAFQTLRSTRQQLRMLKYEPPLTGTWPKYEYKAFLQLEEELMQLSSLYYTLFARIEDTNETKRLLQSIGWSQNSVLASLSSSFYMAGHAVKIPAPLPPITTGNISEVYQAHVGKMVENMDLKDYLGSHDGRLILTAVILSEIYYQRVDGIMMIVKTLVGEYGAMDSRVWEDIV